MTENERIRKQITLAEEARKRLVDVAPAQVNPVLRFLRGNPDWADVSLFLDGYPSSHVARYTPGAGNRVATVCDVVRFLVREIERFEPDPTLRRTMLLEAVGIAEKLIRAASMNRQREERNRNAY